MANILSFKITKWFVGRDTISASGGIRSLADLIRYGTAQPLRPGYGYVFFNDAATIGLVMSRDQAGNMRIPLRFYPRSRTVKFDLVKHHAPLFGKGSVGMFAPITEHKLQRLLQSRVPRK